jgi:uncharacterized membrane protein YvbJ
MFCPKCGTENKDGAAFCNSCGANLIGNSIPTSADIRLKENEIRLLQEKFDNEASHVGPIVLAIVGMITAIFLVGIVLIIAAWAWDNSKSAAATETEIKLNAAKAELEKMKQSQRGY